MSDYEDLIGLATEAIRRLVHEGWSSSAQKRAIRIADSVDRRAAALTTVRSVDATELALAIASTPRGASGNVEYAERLYARMTSRLAAEALEEAIG